jgi:hypothetical protein
MKPWLPDSSQLLPDADANVAHAEQQARLLAQYWDDSRSQESLERDIRYWLANSERDLPCL